MENFKCFFCVGGINNHLLETALQCTVFFDVFAVFIERGGTDALHLATSQGWLEQIGCVHRARSIAGTNDGVDFVDKQDDILIVSHLVDNGFDALFELSAILCASHHRSHVESHDALVEQHTRHFSLNNAKCQALDDGRFTHTGLANQHGIVLFPAAQDLCDALNFVFSAHHGVEAAFARHFCDVFAVFVDDRCSAVIFYDISSLRALFSASVALLLASAVRITVVVDSVVVIIVVACESSTVLGQGKSAVLPFKVAFFCQFVVSHNLYHTKNVDNVRKFSMWLNQTSAL